MPGERHQRSDLVEIARQAMVDRGLEPNFSPAAARQLEALRGPASADGLRDLTGLSWCSIDNDDSRDLDQLSVSQARPDGGIRILVAVADVDAVVAKDSAIDQHARGNTTSVYTAAQIFPMLPEKLSTDLTSLNEHEERVAMVMDMEVGA